MQASMAFGLRLNRIKRFSRRRENSPFHLGLLVNRPDYDRMRIAASNPNRLAGKQVCISAEGWKVFLRKPVGGGSA